MENENHDGTSHQSSSLSTHVLIVICRAIKRGPSKEMEAIEGINIGPSGTLGAWVVFGCFIGSR